MALPLRILSPWVAFPTPGALTHTRITWAFLPTAPQVPGVTLRSPLCSWCFGHSSRRGARQLGWWDWLTSSYSDIWKDLLILHKLHQGTFPFSILAIENDRIGHQITRFHWENSFLFQLWLDGTRHIVVWQMHKKFGHFGIRKTHSMLHSQYWWTNMY